MSVILNWTELISEACGLDRDSELYIKRNTIAIMLDLQARERIE